MVNPLAKNDIRLDETVQALSGRGESLALQHLNYTLMMEQNRAIITQHAMKNTELLMDYATKIMNDNPEASGAIKEIMYSYLSSTSDSITVYGKPYLRKELERR